MNKNANIIVTGSAGFIASNMVKRLNESGYINLFLVDDFSREDKKQNYENLKFISLVDRNQIDTFLESEINIHAIIHFGAKTDTTEMDYAIHQKLNVDFSKKMWLYATKKNIPIIYASSAATYGNGELGYKDSHEIVEKLHPLNPYGVSKNEFDKWALQQTSTPPHWYGLKFFNVYGPNEYHKGRMASVIFHAYHQILQTGKMRLFNSHNPNYNNGEQIRDFIYVKDIVNVTLWLLENLPSQSGLYNLGTGKGETFLTLAHAIFTALKKEPQIEFVDTPLDIRDKYQYFTEAKMDKLRSIGYTLPFYDVTHGTIDYVQNHLMKK